MLKLTNISKRFGARTVLDGVLFVVNAGERAAVVGPNGSGKTTLLNIISGVEPADGGSVALTPSARLAYLRQGYAQVVNARAGDVFPHAFSSGDQIEALATAIAGEADAARAEALAAEYERAVVSAASASGVTSAWRELALRPVAPDEHVGALSGGEQTKLALIDALAAAPDVLLLDEPTNNLDLPALEWLDGHLASFAGAVLLVSHDRALIDAHATSVLELDARTGRIEAFAGGYAEYAAEKARREADLWARYRRQQERERRMQREIASIKQSAQRREHISQNDYYRRRMKKFMRRAVVLERRLTREMQAGEHVEKPQLRAYRVNAELPAAQRSGDRMLALESATISIGGRTLIDAASLTIGWADRVVLLGANGSGKTTLLRAMLGEHPLSAGRLALSPSARPGYLPQHEEPGAVNGDTPVDIVRGAAAISETEARRFLHRFLFSGDDALRPVRLLSYGERRRLALARLVLAGANLLLLDEPTNHLDIPSREAFEAALDSFPGAMLIVTHDRYFIERFGERLLAIEGGRLVEA